MEKFELKNNSLEGKEDIGVYNFLDLNGEVMEKLKNEISIHKGLVRIFVHPDFQEYREYDERRIKKGEEESFPEGIERAKNVEEALERILSSTSKHLPPLIIFQGASDGEEFREKINKLNSLSKNDIYVIRTSTTNPSPLPSVDYEARLFGKRPEEEETEALWHKLIIQLKQLGVKRITIGGAELYVTPESKENLINSPKGVNSFGGCLGAVIRRLKDFDIILSGITWPEGRWELQK